MTKLCGGCQASLAVDSFTEQRGPGRDSQPGRGRRRPAGRQLNRTGEAESVEPARLCPFGCVADERPPVPAAVLLETQESDPLEVVAFFRDEMANVVWGVGGLVRAINIPNLPYSTDRISVQLNDFE